MKRMSGSAVLALFQFDLSFMPSDFDKKQDVLNVLLKSALQYELCWTILQYQTNLLVFNALFDEKPLLKLTNEREKLKRAKSNLNTLQKWIATVRYQKEIQLWFPSKWKSPLESRPEGVFWLQQVWLMTLEYFSIQTLLELVRLFRPKAEARPQAQPEARRSEARPETQPKAQPEARPQARSEAQPEARPQAQPEARRSEARPEDLLQEAQNQLVRQLQSFGTSVQNYSFDLKTQQAYMQKRLLLLIDQISPRQNVRKMFELGTAVHFFKMKNSIKRS